MAESDLNNQEEEICIICNENDLEDNHLFKKTQCDCNILFHNNCYNEYLLSCQTREDMKCPVCRKQIELTVSDMRDLDDIYYNKLRKAKPIFFFETMFFWFTVISFNYSVTIFVLNNKNFYFDTPHGLNNYFSTAILIINTLYNIEFYSLLNYYTYKVKSNTNSNQENDLISFVIYYLLYLLSFGMFYYMISIKDKENPLLLYLPITYSLIRGIGDYSQGTTLLI